MLRIQTSFAVIAITLLTSAPAAQAVPWWLKALYDRCARTPAAPAPTTAIPAVATTAAVPLAAPVPPPEPDELIVHHAWTKVADALPLAVTDTKPVPTPATVDSAMVAVVNEYHRIYLTVTDDTPLDEAKEAYRKLELMAVAINRTYRHAFLEYEIEARLAEVKVRAGGLKLGRAAIQTEIEVPSAPRIPAALFIDTPKLIPVLLAAFDEQLAQALADLTPRQRLMLLKGLTLVAQGNERMRLTSAFDVYLAGHNQMSRFYAAMQARAFVELDKLGTPEAWLAIVLGCEEQLLYPREILNPDGTEASVAFHWIEAWYKKDRHPGKREAIERAIALFRAGRNRDVQGAIRQLEDLIK